MLIAYATWHTVFPKKESEVTSAARSGKHVLCEKPLALSMSEAREMLEACREEIDLGQHENLYAHQVRHFNAAVNGQGAAFVTGEDGLRSLAVATAVLESTKTGQRVAVRY